MGFLLVFIGSGIGGMARHGVGLASLRMFEPGFPFGTLAINIVGSALMGFVVGLLATIDLPGRNVRLFLTTGVIGGFTTFATFSLDAVMLWHRGEYIAAAAYVTVSLLLSLAALFGAMTLTQQLL